MQRHVFISHSAKDADLARRIADALRLAGVRPWMAPDDIDPGVDWGAAIATAIADCETMVLVLTAHSNASKQVAREVQLADAGNHPIIPLRMEALELSPSLRYFLSSSQWVDATRMSEEEMLRKFVGTMRGAASDTLAGDAASGTAATSSAVPAPAPDAEPVSGSGSVGDADPVPTSNGRLEAARKRVRAEPAASGPSTPNRKLRRTSAAGIAALATAATVFAAAQLIDGPSAGDEVAPDSVDFQRPLSPAPRTIHVDSAGGDTGAVKLERRFRPLRIGSSIGGFAGSSATVGAFARDSGGARYLLMAIPASAAADLRVGQPVIQPAARDGGEWPRDEIGRIERFLPLDDVQPAAHLIALVRVNGGTDVDPGLPGTALNGVRAFGPSLRSKAVRVYGARRGEPAGVIEATDGTVALLSPLGSVKRIMFTDFLVSSRFEGDDPGALVVDSGNRAVGLVFARSGEKMLIAPLQPALKAFGVELEMRRPAATKRTRPTPR
jgi:hypothetical protein